MSTEDRTAEGASEARLRSERAMRTVRYLTVTPRKELPPEHIVVHNHVRPARRLGVRGFRAWVAAPADELPDSREHQREYRVVRCDCGWAPELTEHYRVKLGDGE